jgi:hypothetical protein
MVQNTPFGSLDFAKPSPSGVWASGWAIGPDVTNALGVHLYFNGHIVKAVTAGNPRADVARAYPAFGVGHGFAVNIPNESGTLCAYAINAAGTGNNPLVGCKFVDTNPFGNLDAASRQSNGVRVSGWALDPDVATSIPVHVYVDGHPVRAIMANDVRADLAAAFTAYSARHAFAATVPLGPGPHMVCAYAINRGSGYANPLLGCRGV